MTRTQVTGQQDLFSLLAGAVSEHRITLAQTAIAGHTWWRWTCSCGDTPPEGTQWSHPDLAQLMGRHHVERS